MMSWNFGQIPPLPTELAALEHLKTILSLGFLYNCYSDLFNTSDSWGRLDLAVLFIPSTPNRQNRNEVRWNTCSGVHRSTPSSKVV